MASKTKVYIDSKSQKDFYKLITDGEYSKIRQQLVSFANDYSKDNANFLTLKKYLNRKKNSITVKENIPLTNLLNNIISNLENVVKKNKGKKDFNATINDFKIDKNNRDEYNKYLKTTTTTTKPPTTTTKPPTTTTKPPTTTTKPPTTTTTTKAPSQATTTKKPSQIKEETLKKFNNRIDELRDDITNAENIGDHQTITDEINLLRKFAKENELDDDQLNQVSTIMKINLEELQKKQKPLTQEETGPKTEEEAQPEVGPKSKKLTETQQDKNEILFELYKKAVDTKQTATDDQAFYAKAKELYPKRGIHNFNRYVNEQLGLKRGKGALSINKRAKADNLHKELEKLFKAPVIPTEFVSTLPKKVKPKPVPEEELLSATERLKKNQERLKKIREGLAEAKKKLNEEEVKRKTAEIEKLQKEIEELKPEAKKKEKEILERATKTSEASVRQGDYRPHFKNVTVGAVKEELSKSAEEQIRDVKNWFIFDIPDSFTGQGTALDNPLIRQNDAREELLYSGNLYQDFIQAYNGLTEGVDGRKDFYKENNILTSQGVKDGLNEIYYEETEQQFLQRFNKGTNALFSQDQTPFEKNDFQNIYQTPARFHKGGYTQPQFINNNGMVHNNDLWINNPNYFYKGAVVN